MRFKKIKNIPFKGRETSVFVVNWVSPCLSFFFSASTVAAYIFTARVNQPPWLRHLAVLSLEWAGWFASFSFTSLPYVNQHSTTVNLFWLLTFDHSFCHCHFFLNPDLHTTHPPSYPTDLNLRPPYELTINPLLTLAKLLFPVG